VCRRSGRRLSERAGSGLQTPPSEARAPHLLASHGETGQRRGTFKGIPSPRPSRRVPAKRPAGGDSFGALRMAAFCSAYRPEIALQSAYAIKPFKLRSRLPQGVRCHTSRRGYSANVPKPIVSNRRLTAWISDVPLRYELGTAIQPPQNVGPHIALGRCLTTTPGP
jgi:hypothetical protein